MGSADASLAPLAVPKPEPPALALYPGGGVGCTGQCRGRLHIGLYSGTTGAMTGTNVKLMPAVEACCPEPVRARASARATGKSPANPHYAVRAALQSRVFCVSALADRCAPTADFRLCAAKRVQRVLPREGETPERGIVELTATDDDAWLRAKPLSPSRRPRYANLMGDHFRRLQQVGTITVPRCRDANNVRSSGNLPDERKAIGSAS